MNFKSIYSYQSRMRWKYSKDLNITIKFKNVRGRYDDKTKREGNKREIS